MESQKLQSLIKNLPHKPGVYKFKNKDSRIIYVGKAKNLAKRVRSYFRKQAGRPKRTEKLIEAISDFEWTVVETELEALFLETNLIKELRPKYNVLMKDDKNYVYIKLTKNEDFPRIKLVRRVSKDGARYFGPKTSAGQVKKTLILLQKLFNYRSCDLGIEWKNTDPASVKITKKNIAYPCLDYHIKRCKGPCIAEITPEEYGKNISQIEAFLEGNTSEIENSIKESMGEAVKNKNFEKAAKLRDRLLSIEEMMRKQIVTAPDQKSMDVISFTLEEGKAYFALFQVRTGKLIGQENFIANAHGYDEGDEQQATDVIESFLKHYYERAQEVPGKVLLPNMGENKEIFESYLTEKRTTKVSILQGRSGRNKELLELATKNALSFQKQHKARWAGFESKTEEGLEELKNVLKLSKIPKRIECYDISHLGGTDTVASMVVFENGKPKKSDYRKFHLKSIAKGEIDDFKSMNEILLRRLRYLKSLDEGLELKKARKKDAQFICEKLGKNPEELDASTFLVLLEKGECKKVFEYKLGQSSKVFLKNSELNQNIEDYLREIFKKTKAQRLYLKTENKEKFLKIGFKEVRVCPQEFSQNNENGVLLALDKNSLTDKSFQSKPDLLVIDGGKGQLNSAKKAMDKLGLKLNMISLAKREEEVFVPGKSLPLLLPKENPGNKILQQARNEAHRFAISFQKKTRKKHLTASALDKIEGVGEKIKMKLLNKYGSLEQIKVASKEELEALIGKKLTEKIRKL